jgi:hypothetical protein
VTASKRYAIKKSKHGFPPTLNESPTPLSAAGDSFNSDIVSSRRQYRSNSRKIGKIVRVHPIVKLGRAVKQQAAPTWRASTPQPSGCL